MPPGTVGRSPAKPGDPHCAGRAFTSIMLVLALLVLRNLYFKMGDARRRALRVEGR